MLKIVKKAKQRIKFSLNMVYSVGNGALLRLMTTLMLVTAPVSSFAGEVASSGGGSGTAGMAQGLSQLLGTLSWAFTWIGGLLLVAALVSAFTALRNEDGERAQKSFGNAIVALVVAANKPILQTLLGLVTSDVTIGARL